MHYQIIFKPRAFNDGEKLPEQMRARIFEKITLLENDLTGNVKHLTDFFPEYRLRVGDYRVLFEIEGDRVVVYRIRHRKDVYR